MFEPLEIAESIYEGVVEHSYKELPGHTPTVLVTALKSEENPPCKILTLIRSRVITSTIKYM